MKKKNYKLPILNLITGCMFAGKTAFLIKKIKRHLQSKQKVIVFKPKKVNFVSITKMKNKDFIPELEKKIVNNLYENDIVSHDSEKLPAIAVNDSKEILQILKQKNEKFDVIAIDEAHFFNLELIEIVENLLDPKYGYIIWICGLNKGFCEHNLKLMNELLSMADNIFKFNAVCDLCHENPATKIQAVDQKGLPIEPEKIKNFVGGKEKYQVRCRLCYKKFFWNRNK